MACEQYYGSCATCTRLVDAIARVYREFVHGDREGGDWLESCEVKAACTALGWQERAAGEEMPSRARSSMTWSLLFCKRLVRRPWNTRLERLMHAGACASV
jgi:hypothetical protein